MLHTTTQEVYIYTSTLQQILGLLYTFHFCLKSAVHSALITLITFGSVLLQKSSARNYASLFSFEKEGRSLWYSFFLAWAMRLSGLAYCSRSPVLIWPPPTLCRPPHACIDVCFLLPHSLRVQKVFRRIDPGRCPRVCASEERTPGWQASSANPSSMNNGQTRARSISRARMPALIVWQQEKGGHDATRILLSPCSVQAQCIHICVRDSFSPFVTTDGKENPTDTKLLVNMTPSILNLY